ncbi:MAG TPA: SpoIID/LytB domain-containing protein [Candidatus Sulfotelmatobacter sp.]|nr:SpoIID/LytB domain-containing protein [Candidatus Sulfotelmatobacter sp.]
MRRWPLRMRAGAAVALLPLLVASCAPPPAPPTPPGAGVPTPAPVPPAAPPPAPLPPLALHEEPLVTVGLAWDRDTLQLAALDNASFRHAPWPDARDLPSHGSLRLRAESSGVRVETLRAKAWETMFVSSPRDTCWLAALQPTGPVARWNGKQWRGALGVFLNPRGRLTLVARLPLETYLQGVVPSEIGALGDDRIEAGRAQAIAARSYTLFYRGRRAAEGFDLFGTVEDQFYGAVESEKPLATRCVAETRGQVAVWEGQPIRANYCSTCGGISAEVWEAWPTPALGYLTSHRDRAHGTDFCSGSAHYRWRETWTADEFMANLARFGPANGVPPPPSGWGDLVDASVASRSRSGRVWDLRVTTTTGVVEIPAYVIRLVLRRGGQPGAILRSNLFKLAVKRDPATRAATAVVASGAGSGHGVGLCQTGALAMAQAGAKAREILEHYYPGARLETLYH